MTESATVDVNRRIIEEFRANGGRVGGMFAGADLVLLTTTGARTGRPRTSPTGYLADGGRILVFASNAGGDTHPAWYHNLVAEPTVTVEIGDGERVTRYRAVAVVTRGAERDRLYARQGELVPPYAEYQRQTSRTIPVVALYPERGRALGDEFVRVHDELRRQLTELRGALDRGEPLPAGADLGVYCLAFCDSLGAHHDNEEQRGMPRLAAEFPYLAPVLARITDEHRVVAEIGRRLRALLDAGDRDRLGAELDGLAAELERHFDYEERSLVAALNALPAGGPRPGAAS